MMFQKKLDRAMEWLKDKNKVQELPNSENLEIYNENNEELDYYDPRAEWLAEENNNIKLEKNDVLALIISAFIVFAPIFLIMIIILVFVFR